MKPQTLRLLDKGNLSQKNNRLVKTLKKSTYIGQVNLLHRLNFNGLRLGVK